MKMDKSYKPELCASDDSTRTQLCEPWLDVEKKRLCATNGHMLISVPIETDDVDATGPLPSDALKAARKACGRSASEISLSANGTVQIPGGASFPRDKTVQFPPIDQVIPSYKKGDKGTVTFGVNAHYLATLAKALGSDTGVIQITIKIENGTTLDPLLVSRDVGHKDEVALVMPCRV
jgi:hypothetical protein